MQKNIKKIVTLIFTVTAFTAASAQEFVPLKSDEVFKTRMARESAETESIESNFTQIKYMDLLAEKVESKGKFYFKKSDKISLDYGFPVKYLIIINGKKIKIVSEGKKNIYELSSNKTMAQMQTLLSACMTGNIADLGRDYKSEYSENDKFYKVKITPTGAAGTYMSGIEIIMDKKDLSVHRLKMTETSSDYTEYLFTDKKRNTGISEDKFSLK